MNAFKSATNDSQLSTQNIRQSFPGQIHSKLLAEGTTDVRSLRCE